MQLPDNNKRNLTYFTLYKNTPLVDFQNTIHFRNNIERDNFFNKMYIKKNFNLQGFNYARDKSCVKIPANVDTYHELMGYNYLSFIDNDTKSRYYAYILNIEYINSAVIEIKFLIDGIMTYCQGKVLNNLEGLKIYRQHLTWKKYNELLPYLKKNDDILTTSTKRYVYENNVYFADFIVLMQSSASLEHDFGTKDDPQMIASLGTEFDKIVTPLTIYACDLKDFTYISATLAAYPWISQNIRKIIMLPKIFFNNEDFEIVKKDIWHDMLYKLSQKGLNKESKKLNKKIEEQLNFSMEKLYNLFNLSMYDKHLLRDNYFSCEVYNWNGEKMLIDFSKLSEKDGLKWDYKHILGIFNEISFFIKNYNYDPLVESDYRARAGEKTYENNLHVKGSFLNNAINFIDFDSLPVLIDNGNLTYSKNAHQRNFNESQLLSNRVNNIISGNNFNSLTERLIDAGSLISEISPTNILGKFKDEQNYYKMKEAKIKDLSLETPTITQQTNNNGIKIKNNFFGITVKYSAPIEYELEKIKKYYKMFGYEVDEDCSKLEDVESMSICNYIKFEGSWTLENVDPAINEIMKAQFENGVRFWHNKNIKNPIGWGIKDNIPVIKEK